MINLPCIKTINVYDCDGIPTILVNIHNNYAFGYVVSRNGTFEPCYIAKINGYYAHGKTLKEARKEARNKSIQAVPLKKRFERFISKYPFLDCVIPNKELSKWHNYLTDSCLFGREIFAKDNSINMDDSMSVKDFLELTIKDGVFGNETMKELKKMYEIN